MLDYKFDFSAASQLKRYPPSGINVLVAGGGLGGMFAAMNCFRKGHNVKVIESAKGFDSNNGGFIRIGGSIIDGLENFPGLQAGFGLMDQNATYTVYSQDGDTLVGPIHMPKGAGAANAGINVHRSSLNRCLYEYVRALGIEVIFNTRITSYYDNGENGGCISKTGEKFEADIVIAADGIGSHSVDIIENEQQAEIARSSGYAVYRCTYPAKDGYKIPNVAKRFRSEDPEAGTMGLWLAPHGYAVNLCNEEVINFHLVHPDTGDASERWDHNIPKSDVLTYVDEDKWSPDIRDMVAAAPDDSIFNWRLVFRNPKPNWVSKNGRVVQLGDAAHTFLPSSGNGATQAMEDGIVLATCLQLAGKDQVPLALRVHNKLRFERTSCAQKIGFKNRDHWIGVSKEEARNSWRPQVGSWITKHNPEAYAYDKYGQCVNHLIAGAPFENDNIPPGHKYVPWTMEDFLSGKADVVGDTGNWN